MEIGVLGFLLIFLLAIAPMYPSAGLSNIYPNSAAFQSALFVISTDKKNISGVDNAFIQNKER